MLVESEHYYMYRIRILYVVVLVMTGGLLALRMCGLGTWPVGYLWNMYTCKINLGEDAA